MTEDSYFKPGDLIRGVFRVRTVLAGGMGVVYIVRQLSYEEAMRSPDALKSAYMPPKPGAADTPRDFALKSFHRQLLMRSDAPERFQREAQIWIGLRPHPNIVRAISFDKGLPLLQLEYIDGGDLHARLKTPLTLQETARIALQFCRGMIFLFESAGIIHRDIKPPNILLGADGTVKITDFGLAKAVMTQTDNPQSASSTAGAMGSHLNFVTKFGEIMGSLPWMSPEQFTNPEAVTVTSDVYSFGVVLYEMLTGQRPFTARTIEQLTWKIHHEKPLALAQSFGIDPQVSAIVMKCLEKNPAHRYPDFASLRDDLERWATHRGWSNIIPENDVADRAEASMTAADWMNRGYSLVQLGKTEESYECYQRAFAINPTALGVNANLGAVLARLGRHDEAIVHYRKETELQPQMALPWDKLAQGYFGQKLYAAALEASRRAFALGPDNLGIVRTYAIVALVAGAMPDYNRATAAAKTLLSRPPNNTVNQIMNQAIQFMQSGDPKTAVELHQLSVEKFPNVALAWYNFGVTFHRFRNFDAAVSCYSNAINLNPKSAPPWVFRGLIRGRHQGDLRGAHADWQAAILNDSSHQLAQLVKQLVDFNFSPQIKQFLDQLEAPGVLQYSL